MRKNETELWERVVKSSQDWQRRCLIMRELLRERGVDVGYLFDLSGSELEKELKKHLEKMAKPD